MPEIKDPNEKPTALAKVSGIRKIKEVLKMIREKKSRKIKKTGIRTKK